MGNTPEAEALARIRRAAFKQRFALLVEQAFGEPIARLSPLSVLEWVPDGQLRSPPKACLLGNEVSRTFVEGGA